MMTRWMNTFHRDCRELEQRGAAPLTDQEKGLRRLPMELVRTCESVFQPRSELKTNTVRSGEHIDELVCGLRDGGTLEPVMVMKINDDPERPRSGGDLRGLGGGGEWYVIDGHHRLEAYRRVSKDKDSRRTHIPVRVFVGTVGEAVRHSIKTNAPDKLNMSKTEKLEAAWKSVLIGGQSKTEIHKDTTISERTVQRMRNALQRAKEAAPFTDFTQWPWIKVQEFLEHGVPQRETNTGWEEKMVRDISKGLAKHFGGLPKQRPRVFAQGLVGYDKETAKAIAEEILTVCEEGGGVPSDPPEFEEYPIELPELDNTTTND